VFSLLGPNGAGKTTTVRILATLLQPDGGRARVAGLDVVAERRGVRRVISLVGQNAAVDEQQTGEENLRMVGQLSGLGRRRSRQRAAELLAGFDLVEAAGRRVATYSGGHAPSARPRRGTRRRPRGRVPRRADDRLDVRSRQGMWATVRELAGRGVTVFLTTQYLEEADRLADRVAVLDGGRVVAQGTPTELKARTGGQRLDITLTDSAAYAHVRRVLGERTVSTAPDTLALAVATDGTAAHVRSLLDEVDPCGDLVHTFSLSTTSLDDVFLALTGHGARTRRPPMSDALTLTGRCLRLSRRNVEALITSLMLPVMLMLLFVYLFGGAIRTDSKYVDYVVPGVIVLCVGFGASVTAISVSEDMKRGVVDRFRSLDVSGAAMLWGHVAASLVRNAVSTVLVVGVALLIGFRPVTSPSRWLVTAGILLVFAAAMSWLAAVVGLLAGSPEAANGFTFFISFLPYASSAFVPVQTMPRGCTASPATSRSHR
jgi:ABC-2 type transport system ATP-binding protein